MRRHIKDGTIAGTLLGGLFGIGTRTLHNAVLGNKWYNKLGRYALGGAALGAGAGAFMGYDIGNRQYESDKSGHEFTKKMRKDRKKFEEMNKEFKRNVEEFNKKYKAQKENKKSNFEKFERIMKDFEKRIEESERSRNLGKQ